MANGITKTLNSSSCILATIKATLNATPWTLATVNNTINSRASIIDYVEGSMDSDSFIKKLANEKTLSSDSTISGIQHITSDSYIFMSEEETTLNSDLVIHKVGTKAVYGGVVHISGTADEVAQALNEENIPSAAWHLVYNGTNVSAICKLK